MIEQLKKLFNNKNRPRKGQMSSVTEGLLPYALAIVTLIIIVTVGAVVLGGVQEGAADENTVTDESHDLSGALPIQYTLDEVGSSDFLEIDSGSETVVFQNSTYANGASSNTTLSEGDGYNITYEGDNPGVIWIKNDSEVRSTINDTTSLNARAWNDYTELTTNDATSISETGQTAMGDFSDFFTVLVILGIAVALFMLLNMLRRTGTATA